MSGASAPASGAARPAAAGPASHVPPPPPPRKGFEPRMIELTPPEGVSIRFKPGAMSSRYGAQLLDLLIGVGISGLTVAIVLWLEILDGPGRMALFSLLSFMTRTPYYIISEMIWNGATLGKRAVGLRVISADGRRLTPLRIVARNLMKEVEIFIPATLVIAAGFEQGWWDLALAGWMIGVMSIPYFTPERKRLGDMLGGTIVVEAPRAVLLPDLATAASTTPSGAPGSPPEALFQFDADHLDHYGRHELQALEAILRAPPKTDEAKLAVSRIAETIIAKIGFVQKVERKEHWRFLGEFYARQREHLEHRNLFGDAREDKFHAEEKAWEAAMRLRPGAEARFAFEPAQLEVYGRKELEVLEGILRTPPTSHADREGVARVVRNITRKIGWRAEVPAEEQWLFLQEFHARQKEHLEKRAK